MFKSILTICLWATVFLLSGAHGASGDIEDRFLDADFDSSKSIFIDVKDVSLINVLKIISQQSGLSFVAAQDVANIQITLYLNKIPLNQALHMVLDANGLTYEMQKDSNVFVVKKKEAGAKNFITRIYQLKYATVSTSPLNSTIAGSSPASSSGGLETVVKNSLSPDGKVVEDVRTNSLIITDVPAQFDIIGNTIAKLDVPIPQVLIEVEMLDVSKSTADQLGITYGATPLTFTGGTSFTNWPFGPTIRGQTPSPTITTGTGWNANGMTAALSFLTTKTDARTLARPRILTLNNQTAQIQISTDQAISITSTTTTGTTSQTAYTPERYTTGVILKVTPQANLLTREVTMAVSPKVIDVILSVVQPPTGSQQGSIYDPETRGSDSILKLKDGQSMVIGGLMTGQLNSTVTKLPFLGDLPLIGGAFRSKKKTKTDRELIIFLTPHIIDDTNQSALKGETSSISPQEALDIQEALSNHSQEINNSLNIYEMKKN